MDSITFFNSEKEKNKSMMKLLLNYERNIDNLSKQIDDLYINQCQASPDEAKAYEKQRRDKMIEKAFNRSSENALIDKIKTYLGYAKVDIQKNKITFYNVHSKYETHFDGRKNPVSIDYSLELKNTNVKCHSVENYSRNKLISSDFTVNEKSTQFTKLERYDNDKLIASETYRLDVEKKTTDTEIVTISYDRKTVSKYHSVEGQEPTCSDALVSEYVYGKTGMLINAYEKDKDDADIDISELDFEEN